MNQKYKNALPAAGGAAGSGDGPRLDPVAVQNYAYLKLLKWDHLHRPFPEVGAPGKLTAPFLLVLPNFWRVIVNNSHSRKLFLCKLYDSWFLVIHRVVLPSPLFHFGTLSPPERRPWARWQSLFFLLSPHPLATSSLSRWIGPILDFLFKRNHTILAIRV